MKGWGSEKDYKSFNTRTKALVLVLPQGGRQLHPPQCSEEQHRRTHTYKLTLTGESSRALL